MNASQPTAPPPPWLPDWMLGVWALFAEHPFVLAPLIVLVGVAFAVLARVFVLFWGLKVARRTATDLDEKMVRLGAFVAALFVLYLSVMAAVQTLPFGERTTTILTRVVVSFLVLQLIRVGLRASHIGLAILSHARKRFPIVEERTIPVFDLVATVMIVAIAAYALLQVWNIDPTAWLASAGVVGIAVGFAAKDTLANLFAGFFIIADTPYKLGDFVVLDTGERGEVTRVGIRSTRMLTRDDIEIIIPNSQMANFKVVNESGGRSPKFRIRIKVGVAYGSDVDRVVTVLEEVAQVHERVCRDPAARAWMRAFGDSSLDFELLCWLEHPSQRGLVSHELYMDVYKRLRSEGIQIPFPQRDVWMRRTPGPEGEEDPGEVSGPPG